MKKNNIATYLIAALLGSIACTACQDEDTFDGKGEMELSFAPDVQRVSNRENVTRTTTGDGFFNPNDQITVSITTSRGTKETKLYTLNNSGIFTGDFHFNLDNTYITNLEAKWPSDQERNRGIKLDQREWDDYQKADRLITPKTTNIMPTAEPVPLKFEHEQCRFSFRMAGQNANGLKIQSIVLELQYDDNPDDGITKNTAGAFWAYCNNTETASLVLVPGIEIKGDTEDNGGFPIVGDRYMIGMAEVGDENSKYTGGIWLKKNIDITLQRNTDYLITLTPEGYDLMATIEIHGFGQDEGFIGLPSKPNNE